jgi:hypothetical protein
MLPQQLNELPGTVQYLIFQKVHAAIFHDVMEELTSFRTLHCSHQGEFEAMYDWRDTPALWDCHCGCGEGVEGFETTLPARIGTTDYSHYSDEQLQFMEMYL